MGTIYKEDIMMVNIRAANIGAANLIKQTLLSIKGQIGPI
jgi:hypothetical protein